VIRPSTDGAAVVNTQLKWISLVDDQPGRGQKVLVINKADGVARIDNYTPLSQITHWQALPTFEKESP
jgi:hypothetical protein